MPDFDDETGYRVESLKIDGGRCPGVRISLRPLLAKAWSEKGDGVLVIHPVPRGEFRLALRPSTPSFPPVSVC